MKERKSKLANIIVAGIFIATAFTALAAPVGGPTVIADAGSDLTVDLNAVVQFDGSGSTGIGTLEYTWYYRDGTVATIGFPNPTHSYSSEGVYEVGLIVKDSVGYYGLDTVQIMVKNYYPTADAGSDRVVNEDETVNFDASASSDLNNDIVSYLWDFGDGSGGIGLATSTVYEKAGTYYVTLTVTDNDGAYDEDIITVTVNNVVPTADEIANGEVDDDLTVYEDDVVAFDSSASSDSTSDMPLLEYALDFGDGSQGYGIATTHTYTKQGVYTATLRVIDDNDAFTQDTITVNVLNAVPVADAGLDQAVNEGSSIFFNGLDSSDTPSDEPLLEYSWDFETDSVYDDIGWHSKNTWWDDGNHDTTLEVEDDNSAVDTDSQAVTVNNVAPSPSIFNYSVHQSTIVDFGLRIAGEKWHDVQLWMYENSTEFAYRQIVRTPGSPNDQMDFVYDVEIQSGNIYEAVIFYTPMDDPINGQIQGASPCWLILYLEDGNEFRFHRAFNYNKPDEWTWTIDLSSIVKVDFEAEIYDPGMDTVTFNWDFGDLSTIVSHTYVTAGTYPTKVTDTVTHVYVVAGVYTITLSGDDDDAGHDIFTLDLTNAPGSVTIDNLAPRAYADVDIITALEDELFEFSGSGTDLLSDGLTYYWDFDDGNSATGQVVTHPYVDEGIYLVTLTVTDSHGASGKDYLFVTVTNVNPIAEAGDDQVADEDDIVYFYASGSGDTFSDHPLLFYAWDFGDGSKGYGEITDHVYTKNGLYIATLTVQDNNGAVDTDTLTVTVNNPAPYNPTITADQNVDEDELIFFTGSAMDTPSDESLLTYVWNFDDGTMGYGRNPTHSYSPPGVYLVTLTVTDDDLSSANANTTILIVNVEPAAYAGATILKLYGPSITIEFEGRGFDTFSDQSSLAYEWDLGGGVYEYTPTVSVDFSATGIYYISFEVTDIHLSVTATIQIRIDVILDSDGDMLTDEEELVEGTNPDLWDTDGDNLLDYWEVHNYPTDPLLEDTDDDGLNDWEEITYLGLTDPDEDGLLNPVDWDSDGDWIRDGVDVHPLLYDDTDGTTLAFDAISVSNSIGYGVSVVMYGGTCYVKPTLSPASPSVLLMGGIGIYVSIESTCSTPFNAQIRIRYDQATLPGGVNEATFVIYLWSSAKNMWIIAEDTGVDVTHDFVWAKVTKFSIYGIGDANLVDSDGDGLSNWYELNTLYDIDFRKSAWTTNKYYSGNPLYIKNNRIQYQIPSSSSGTIDLFGLGFTKDDFATANTWQLTNGGTTVHASLSTPKVYNAQSASLYYKFYYVIFKMHYMRIDVRGCTDPHDSDSDDDGLSDGIEVSTYGTHPLDFDTDGDGLGDGKEVNSYRTDPKDSDTDNDGYGDGGDLDPLTNLHVYVKIKEILQSEDYVDVWPWQAGDFYVKVAVNGAWQQSSGLGDQNPHPYPNIVWGWNVPDSTQDVNVRIELWDDDPWPFSDHKVDISRSGYEVDLTYNVKTGMWSGEDSLNDRNGMGHASGNEDGSYGWDEDDCDIWFDIYQNGYDGDKVPFWQEVHTVMTNPKSTNWDSDSDGMPDWWEVRFGLDIANPSDAGGDLDRDALSNLGEYRNGTDPRFLEVNLVVSFNWDVDVSYMTKFIIAMKQASDYMYDVTDGMLYFRLVILADNNAYKNDANMIVKSGNAVKNTDHNWPHVPGYGIGGYLVGNTGSSYAIVMPETFNGKYPNEGRYPKTIVHEFGHYGFHLRDEYQDAQRDVYPCNWVWDPWPIKKTCVRKGPPGFMNQESWYSEMTTANDYNTWSPPSGFDTTEHFATYGVSCWERFFDVWGNYIWFDLNKDGVDDTSYPSGYNAIGGPGVMVHAGYTFFKVYNT